MGLFGFLKAPAKILNRLTGATNSRKQMNAVRDEMDGARNNLAQANRVAAAQQEKLQKMLGEISGLDREQKSLQKDYKHKLKRLEYDEGHLKSLGQHYSKTIGKVEAQGNELLSRKSQLEEKSAKLKERAIPLEEKLKEMAKNAQKIDGGEIRTVAERYQQKFKEAEANKEKLKGISKETSPELFMQHQKMVKGLASLHQETEEAIKSKHAGLSETHRKIVRERDRLQKDYGEMEAERRDIRRGQEKLERKAQYVHTFQGMLELELKRFAEAQEALKAETGELTVFQQKLADLEKSYGAKKTEAEKLQKETMGASAYRDALANRLNSLQGTLDFIGDRYQRQAGNAKILAGIGTGALALATLGTGAVGALAAGAGSFAAMNAMQKDIEQNLKKWGAYQEVDLESFTPGSHRIPDWNKTPLNRVDFKSRAFDAKIKMPEFGGLAQSLKHFEMPTLPTLAELPPLSAALGKMRSLEDIANLGILPGSTTRSPNRSLLNPQLMQTFSALMKSANQNKTKKGGSRTASLAPLGSLSYGR